MSNKLFYWLNGAVTVVAMSFLFYVIYFKPGAASANDLGWMSGLNAALNSISATFVILGVVAIKRSQINVHKVMMILGFIASSLFLISYVIYHHFHGDTPFKTEGIIRYVYYFILISHIALSIFVFPMILSTLYFAFTNKLVSHKKIARWTFPLWIYVSVTGVAIYGFLKLIG